MTGIGRLIDHCRNTTTLLQPTYLLTNSHYNCICPIYYDDIYTQKIVQDDRKLPCSPVGKCNWAARLMYELYRDHDGKWEDIAWSAPHMQCRKIKNCASPPGCCGLTIAL